MRSLAPWVVVLMVAVRSAWAAPVVETLAVVRPTFNTSEELFRYIAFDNGSWPTMSDDGLRFTVPVLNTGGKKIYDRRLDAFIEFDVPTDSGELAPPQLVEALSSNGRFAAGRNRDGSLFRWSEADGVQLLRDASGQPVKGRATGVSSDGNRIVGDVNVLGIPRGQGLDWRASTGIVEPFFITSDFDPNRTIRQPASIQGMSADGLTLAVSPLWPFDRTAFPNETEIDPSVWITLDGTMAPTILSSNGGRMLYYFNDYSSRSSTRLFENGQFRNAPDRSFLPYAMSADGSRIVGTRTGLFASPGVASYSYPELLDNFQRVTVFGANDSSFADFMQGMSSSGLLPFFDISSNGNVIYGGAVGSRPGIGLEFLYVAISIPEASTGTMLTVVGGLLLGCLAINRHLRARRAYQA